MSVRFLYGRASALKPYRSVAGFMLKSYSSFDGEKKIRVIIKTVFAINTANDNEREHDVRVSTKLITQKTFSICAASSLLVRLNVLI